MRLELRLEMLPGYATWRCYLEDFNLLSSTCCKMEMARSVVFDRISYPLLFWHSAVQSTDMASLHLYPCICSVVPCLRVLWMSTHGCFSPSFSPFHSTWLSRPDVGAQDPDATVGDGYYYTGGAYYYVQPADDDQE